MLSKNNYKERLRKMEQKKERFSIRKLSVGAASVLIGFFFMGVGSQTTVHADTVTPQVQTAKSNDNAALTSSKQDEKVPASQASSSASSSASEATSSAASASSATQVNSETIKENNVEKVASQTVSVNNLENEKASANQLSENKVVSSSATSTHANGTGGYTQNGIAVPSVSEPEASQFWDEFNQETQPMSKSELTKLGLDENTFYESATNKTKWHAVSWLYLHNPKRSTINLGTFLYHNQDGTLAAIRGKNILYREVTSALLNANNGDNDFYGLKISQEAYLVPIVDADNIYVHQGSTLTFGDIKKALASKAENLTGLVSGDWVTDQEEMGVKVVDTSKVGSQTGAARLDYVNGTKTSVSIPVTVIGPAAKQTVNVNQGDPVPAASSVITNDPEIQEYFPGTTYSWKETPKTDVPGSFDATVVTNWPDGQKTEVNTTIVVKQMFKVNDENKTVTRTIIDNVPKQAPVTVVQKVNLTRQVTTDMSGKFISATDWQVVGTNEWDAYTPKAVEGYTPNPAEVASQVVTGDTLDTTVNINYTANTLTQTVNYVDRTTNDTISIQTVTGKSDTDVPFTADIPLGWVADSEVPSTINFKTSDPAPLTIYIKHGTEAVTDGTTKNVTRIVNYLDPATKATHQVDKQVVQLTRTGEKDLVTGKITYSDWSTGNFKAVSAPTIAGYTVTNPNAAEAMSVTGDTQDSVVTFEYTANNQTQVVNYVDANDHNNVVSEYDVDGKTGETVGLDIPGNVPTNWVIANPENIPTSVTFGPNGNAPITVYVKHGTEAITNPADTQKTITRTINYALLDSSQPTLVEEQKVTLSRTGEKDLVTGEVTYSDWSTGKFDKVDAPDLQGYYVVGSAVAPSMTVTAETPDSTVTFHYAASWHNQVVSYVNKANNALISTSNISGRTGSSVAFTPQIPSGWVISEDQEVPTSITFGTTDPKPITIYIQHGTKNVSDNTTKSVTRSIYTQIDGQAPMLAKRQNVILTRTAAQDLVTGEITYGAWDTAKFDAVTAPEIAGYTVTNPNAAPALDVNGNSEDTTVIFDYSANEQTQNIKFVNYADTNDVVSQYDVKGKSNTTTNLDIENHVPTNWVLVPGQSLPTTVTFGTSENTPIVVYVQHGTKEITNDQTSKTITRTVNYVDPTNNETKNVENQSVTLSRTATQDLVTGDITYGAWNTSSFAAVAAPTIPGYYVVGNQNAPIMMVTADTPDSTVTFHYAASSHVQIINYVDGGNKTSIIASDAVPGTTGETVSYTPSLPAGWVISEGQKVPTSITFGSENPAPITIYVKHGTKEITNDQTSKTITRTVNYVDPINNETKNVDTQSVTLSRTGTQDLVTGEITYGAWNSAKFDAVKAPEVAGYTVTNPDAAPAMAVTGDTQSSVVTFKYTANSHDQVINYVDNGNKTTVVGTYKVTGKTGETVNTNIQSHVPTNWVIVPGSEITTQVTFGADTPAPITVYVEHGTKEITNDQTSKTITRTVNYVNPVTDATDKVAIQKATLSRTGTQDLVTDEITYGPWNSSKFDAVKAPEIAGYTVTNPDAAPAMAVTGNTQSSTVVFTYNANSHAQVINFVDKTTNSTVKSYDVTGKTGETVGLDISGNVPTNWVIVNPESVPTSVTFDANTPAPITVYVEHGTKEITNDQTSKTITRTVNYVNPVIDATDNVAIQKATLSRTGTQDLVTGEITYGAWNSAKFDAVKAPEIAGYTVTNPDAASAMTVTADTSDATVTFVYSANNQQATIEYVNTDNQSQVVKTDTINGKTGQTVSYKAQAPEGWVIVGNAPTHLTFTATKMPVTKILVRQLQSYKYSVSTNTSFTTHVGANASSPSLIAANASFNWTDKNGNPIAAPTGYKVSWKQVPSTSTITDETGTLEITYSDGTTTDVKVPVTVKGATPVNGNKVYQGEAAPNARLAVNTRDVNSFGIKAMTWGKEPDTNVAGAEIPGVVKVDYSDGTSQLVNVTIDVIGVEKGIDHKDDKMLYRVYDGDSTISGTSGKIVNPAQVIYSRNRLIDYAYPVGNPKHITYTKWQLL